MQSTITANFKSDIEDVWDVITDYKSWGSDFSRIVDHPDGVSFSAYSNGYQTNFKTTLKKPYERYEFNMRNKNMRGHFIVLFTRISNGTQVRLIGDIAFNNMLISMLAKSQIQKQQNKYIYNFKRILGEV